MLKRLKLENFKSFVQAEVELAPLTFLVGANASGKSNFIDALRVSKGLAMGMRLPEVLDGRRVGDVLTWEGVRGGLAEVAFAGASKFVIEGDWTVTDPVVDDTGAPARPGKRHVTQRIEGQPGSPTRLDVARTGDERDWLASELQEIGFFDPHPSRMRGFGNPDGPLGAEGENLSGLLESMLRDSSRKETVVQWLRELCAPEVTDLEFIRMPELRQVMLAIVEESGLKISVRSLSDGTLRFLYLPACSSYTASLDHPTPGPAPHAVRMQGGETLGFLITQRFEKKSLRHRAIPGLDVSPRPGWGAGPGVR